MAIEKDSITIRWKKPKSDGGAIVNGYIIEQKDDKFGDFTKVKDVGSTVHIYKAKHLLTDNEYMFRVKAKNSVGVGEPAEIKAIIQPKKVICKFNKLMLQAVIKKKSSKIEIYQMDKNRVLCTCNNQGIQ